MSDKVNSFEVLNKYRMDSDHRPLLYFNLKLSGSAKPVNDNDKSRLNFAKADWNLYRNLLIEFANKTSESLIYSLNVNELNDLICNQIQNAVNLSVPKFIHKSNNSLPEKILELIKIKKATRKELKKSHSQALKSIFNKQSAEIKLAIKDYREKTWKNFLSKLGPNPISSRPFWSKINRVRSSKKSPSIPTLVINNVKFETNLEKANFFASILSETFSDTCSDAEFDDKFKSEVLQRVKNHFFIHDFVPFSVSDIYKVIKKLKINSSPGFDQIHNLLLKHLPYEYICKLIYRLVNFSIESGMPLDWKFASITMIPKNDQMCNDPNKYRPISLTSCLGKLTERLIKSRLYYFLDHNGHFAKQQSGFRKKKGAADNLIFFTQKISETLNKGKKACGIFFDISKAFDKVWHMGLIYKLIKCNIPNYILKYIIDFLKERTFRVNVDGSHSKSGNIICSVPQGSVLGPILFLVYINDIPLANSKHISYSSLFADDLSTIFIFKKIGKIKCLIKSYLMNLVSWLFKWRLKMNASKCKYTIFSTLGTKSTIRFDLLIGDGKIPYVPNPLFLGITFDEFLNFRIHTNNLEVRARKRLNIIKIFSHKSWQLSHETLKGMYNALIGSIFTYSFFSLARIAESNLNRLQRVQNRAIRSIYRLEWNSRDSCN